MSEFAGFDLDRSTQRAWSAFQARLADRVAEMSDDEIVIVEVGSVVEEDAEGSAPYVQFCAWGDAMVRCEVSSNAYLDPRVRLDSAAAEVIVELGWRAPTAGRDEDAGEGSSNFFLDTERVDGDRLAVMSTRVLRDVFGVAHPAFLLSDDLGADAAVPVEQSPEAAATFPNDREHLQELVDAALAPYFGHAPSHDEDDDIPVVSGSAMVFVRVLEDAPVVQLFCPLVCGVEDRDRAAFEVSVLNRDQRFLKFVLVGDDVMVHLYLPAYPFAPEHLRAMLGLMSTSVDALDEDLVARVGGRRMFEPTDDEDVEEIEDEDGDDQRQAEEDAEAETEAIHPAMLTLLQLDAESPGSLTPELAASVCAMDRDLILELITWNSEQEVVWRQARDRAYLQGDAEEAEVCGHEMRHAEQKVNLLRRALRLVVERQLGRDLLDQGYVVARRRRRGSAPEKDAALPGLDAAEEPGLFDEA